MLVSLALARSGDITRAQAIADDLDKGFPSDTMLQRYWLPAIRGEIEVARRNPAGAINALRRASYDLGDGGAEHAHLVPAYVRGQAYLMAQQGREAQTEFQKFLDHPGVVLNSPLAALAHVGLARAYALQGDKPKARIAYQDFFSLWKEADPDIPILKQAKGEYAKLQ